MPITKPTTLPRWGEIAGSQGVVGANEVEPASGKKDTGWVPGEEPPAEYFNWWKRLVYDWIQYINDLANQAFTWTAAHVFNAGIAIAMGVLPTRGSLQMGTQTTPSAPSDGDHWYDGTNLFAKIAGAVRKLATFATPNIRYFWVWNHAPVAGSQTWAYLPGGQGYTNGSSAPNQTSGVTGYPVHTAMHLRGFQLYTFSAPTGGNVTVDLMHNGSPIATVVITPATPTGFHDAGVLDVTLIPGLTLDVRVTEGAGLTTNAALIMPQALLSLE